MTQLLAFAELDPRSQARALRRALPQLGLADDWALEDILGADAAIDLVGRDPGGRVALILCVRPGEELAGIGGALAQRAWVEARLPDWRQLAPERGLRPELGARILLIGADFGAASRTAAVAAGIELWRAVGSGAGGRVELLLERLDDAGGVARRGAVGPATPASSRFRPGGSDAELGLTPAELREFD